MGKTPLYTKVPKGLTEKTQGHSGLPAWQFGHVGCGVSVGDGFGVLWGGQRDRNSICVCCESGNSKQSWPFIYLGAQGLKSKPLIELWVFGLPPWISGHVGVGFRIVKGLEGCGEATYARNCTQLNHLQTLNTSKTKYVADAKLKRNGLLLDEEQLQVPLVEQDNAIDEDVDDKPSLKILVKMKAEALQRAEHQTNQERDCVSSKYTCERLSPSASNKKPKHFEGIQKALTKEVKEMSDAFDELEAELDQSIVDRKHDEIERKNLLIEHDNIIADAELSNLRDNIHKDNYNELLNRFSNLEIQSNTQQSNVPVPPSTGVNSCTDASGSQPRSILKKHKIPPAKSDSMKKVEEHPRTIRSSLKTTNRVDSSISSKRTCNLQVDYLTFSRSSNLYTISVEDVRKSTPICLANPKPPSTNSGYMASSFKAH
ncbi:hypothetical protein Tco_1492457 [Tanacetum coccineum]